MRIGCVILAGGKSSRMGTDKALLEINGTNFIGQIAEEMDEFEEKIVARGNNGDLPDISWRMVSDIYPERGPIGGLHAALTACESEALFCLSCDMPLMRRSLIRYLCGIILEEYDAVVVRERDGRVHPLCAVYRKSMAQILEQQILEGNNRLMSVLDKIRVKFVNIDAPKDAQQLRNVNTPKEYFDLVSGKNS